MTLLRSELELTLVALLIFFNLYSTSKSEGMNGYEYDLPLDNQAQHEWRCIFRMHTYMCYSEYMF